MPYYTYNCPECGNFDHFKRMTEDDLLICPVCLSEVKRVYSIPEIHYKGVGFYATDKNEPKRGKDGKIIEAMPGVT